MFVSESKQSGRADSGKGMVSATDGKIREMIKLE